jgi:hypothetical protein
MKISVEKYTVQMTESTQTEAAIGVTGADED